MRDRLLQRLLLLSRWRVVGVSLLLTLVFTLFCYQFLQDRFSFNSDQLYCIHFCDDLLHGHDVQGFHMPAAPYVFPDMVLVLVCSLLTSNLTAAFILYSLLYYGLLLAVLSAICREVGLSRPDSFVTAGVGVAFLLASHFDPVYSGRGALLCYPGNHMGCLLMGLGAIAFVLRAIRRGYRWWSALLLVGVCVPAGFSDQLLIVQYLVPLCAALLLLGICRLIPIRRSLITITLLGFSTLLAMKMRGVFVWLGFVPMRITHTDSAFGLRPIVSLKEFAANGWFIVRDQSLMQTVFILNTMTAATVLVIWSRRVWRSAPASADAGTISPNETRLDGTAILLLAGVLLLAPLSNAGALIATGSVDRAAVTRYLYTWWFLPFLCLALWSRLLPWRPVRLIPWLVTALVIFQMLRFPEPLRTDGFARRYPPLAQALDELVRKHGRLRGFAEYWRARESHYLTQERVDVLPILSWGVPWFHGFNPNAFLGDNPHDLSLPDYNFVIVPTNGEAGPDPEHILARFGKPVEIIPTEHHEIWRYDRLANRQLELFLRAQLAQRLVRDKPFLAPTEPSSLRKPKRNLTACDARGTIHLARGNSFTVRFDRPTTGAMIDISADFADEYSLLFLRGGKELGQTHVPAVEWTGSEIAYCKPGLQSRLVQVPLACRKLGFNEVRITPLGRPQQFTIGHFLVFDEWLPLRSERAIPTDPYRRYEGEKMARLDSAEVTNLADASASAGQARQAAASFQGCMAYGPYTPLSPGRYRIDFALKVEDNTSSDAVAMIDSSACGGQQLLQSRMLSGGDFASADQYAVFSITFDAEDELDLVEYRVMTLGKTAVTLDYVEVTRIAAEK
ncbi:MAG TPA: hypothetical protein VN688_04475 [Gemmataceae bacterium]|nr:hypothetical protein [Gemmataceae bacterium]